MDGRTYLLERLTSVYPLNEYEEFTNQVLQHMNGGVRAEIPESAERLMFMEFFLDKIEGLQSEQSIIIFILLEYCDPSKDVVKCVVDLTHVWELVMINGVYVSRFLELFLDAIETNCRRLFSNEYVATTTMDASYLLSHHVFIRICSLMPYFTDDTINMIYPSTLFRMGCSMLTTEFIKIPFEVVLESLLCSLERLIAMNINPGLSIMFDLNNFLMDNKVRLNPVVGRRFCQLLRTESKALYLFDSII
ncbi:hypothetical protein AKO1_007540 [Acrasis kona]|uniref:Uncharacterized protein n=1 Tax=Acrasis kona TaxID=1008807 RepID=A0AAW2YRD7_9EUKA